MLKFIRFGVREHRGALSDSIKTIRYIDEDEFNKLLRFYEYYAVDERVHQIVFITRNMQRYDIPTWLFIEYDGVFVVSDEGVY